MPRKLSPAGLLREKRALRGGERLHERILGVRLIVCDVDGVLTDGRILVDDAGRETKQFSVLDGTGFALARTAGIRTAILSGRSSRAVAHRARECRIDWVLQGVHLKRAALEKLCRSHKIELDQTAYVGDDLIDLPVFEAVGLAVAVANAVPEAKAAAHLVTAARGGSGALREVVERILRGQERWSQTVEDYLRIDPNIPSANKARSGDLGQPKKPRPIVHAPKN